MFERNRSPHRRYPTARETPLALEFEPSLLSSDAMPRDGLCGPYSGWHNATPQARFRWSPGNSLGEGAFPWLMKGLHSDHQTNIMEIWVWQPQTLAPDVNMYPVCLPKVPQAALGFAPYDVLHGRHPRGCLDVVKRTTMDTFPQYNISPFT